MGKHHAGKPDNQKQAEVMFWLLYDDFAWLAKYIY